MTQPLAVTDGTHGSFIYSCWHDHGGADLGYDTFVAGVPVIAGTDPGGGLYAYGRECLEEAATGDDATVTLHGTHTFTDDQLAELGQVRGPQNLPTGARFFFPGSDEPQQIVFSDDDHTPFVCVGARADGEVYLISLAMVQEYAQDLTRLDDEGLTLYGTHVLPDDILASGLFDE